MANRFGMDYENSGGDFASPGGGTPSGDGGNRRKATEEQTLIPVTIAMLLKASNNTLEDGRELHQVKLVAAMRDVDKNSASNNYLIEDGTGAINVKEWVDDGNIAITEMREEAAVEHQYVRITGKLEEYDGKPQVVANRVCKLTNGNELTYHFLEVVYTGEKYEQGGQIVGTPSQAMNSMNFGGGMQTSTPIANSNSNNNSSALDDALTTFLSNSNEETGGSILDFIAESRETFSEPEIREKFNSWAAEGLIYSTIDDDHFSIVN